MPGSPRFSRICRILWLCIAVAGSDLAQRVIPASRWAQVPAQQQPNVRLVDPVSLRKQVAQSSMQSLDVMRGKTTCRNQHKDKRRAA